MINFIKGDATIVCKVDGIRIICHICNDAGGFGSGFAACIARKWNEVRSRYKAWYNSLVSDSVKTSRRLSGFGTRTHIPLGEIQVVPVKDEHGTIFVVNMIAQHNYKTDDNPIALRYKALSDCFSKLDEWIKSYKIAKGLMIRPNTLGDVTIHMPRIGCGLAGGSWNRVERIIELSLSEYNIFVYDL